MTRDRGLQVGRVLRTGLSWLRHRAANLRCRLAALRFNPIAQEAERQPQTVRLINYGVRDVANGGKRIRIYGWSQRWFFEGDYLILDDQKGGTTRYRAFHVQWPGDPSDMFFADAEFAPR